MVSAFFHDLLYKNQRLVFALGIFVGISLAWGMEEKEKSPYVPPLGKYLGFGDGPDAKQAYTDFISDVIQQSQKEATKFLSSRLTGHVLDTELIQTLAHVLDVHETVSLMRKLNPHSLQQNLEQFDSACTVAVEKLSTYLEQLRSKEQSRHHSPMQAQQFTNAPQDIYIQEATELLNRFINTVTPTQEQAAFPS